MDGYTLARLRKLDRRNGHVRQTRVEQGRRVRSMYRSLGLDRAQAAKLLHVSTRTLHNWESGATSVPWAAYKVLRLLCRMDLPGNGWDGWCFNRGTLWSPEGHGFTGKDFAWLSNVVRSARLFGLMHREAGRLRKELIAERQAHAASRSQPGIELLEQLGDLAAGGAFFDAGAAGGGKRSAPPAAPAFGGTLYVTRSQRSDFDHQEHVLRAHEEVPHG